MKIDIPKIVLTVDLGEYATELAGKLLYVWVNQPKEKLREYDDLVTDLQEKSLAEAQKILVDGKEPTAVEPTPNIIGKVFDQLRTMMLKKREKKGDGIDAKLLQWYAEMWSQGPEESRWTASELQALEEQDPSFLSWAIARSWNKRNEHIQLKKKS